MTLINNRTSKYIIKIKRLYQSNNQYTEPSISLESHYIIMSHIKIIKWLTQEKKETSVECEPLQRTTQQEKEKNSREPLQQATQQKTIKST